MRYLNYCHYVNGHEWGDLRTLCGASVQWIAQEGDTWCFVQDNAASNREICPKCLKHPDLPFMLMASL